MDGSRYIREHAALRDLRDDLEALGVDPFVALGRKVALLEEKALALYVQSHSVSEDTRRIAVAVVGLFSSGKSSFINSILGRDVCPVDACPSTSSITRFLYGAEERIDARTNDGTPYTVSVAEYQQLVQHARAASPAPRLSFDYHCSFDALRGVVLYDTPGFDNPENQHDAKLTESVTRCSDVVFVVIDINQGGIPRSLQTVIDEICSSPTPPECYLIINKADLKVRSQRARIRDQLLRIRSFEKVLLYSARMERAEPVAEQREHLRRLQKQVDDNVRARKSFSLTLSGAPLEGGYLLDTAGEVLKYPAADPDADDLADSAAVLEILQNIRSRRTTLLDQGLRRAIRQFEADRERLLARIGKEVAERVTAVNGGSQDARLKRVNQLFGRSETMLREGTADWRVKVFGASAMPCEVEYPEKKYVLTPYGKLSYDEAAARHMLRALPVFAELKHEISRIAKAVETDFGTDKVKARVKELDALKETVVAACLEIAEEFVRAAAVESEDGYFKTVRRAESAKEAYRDMLKTLTVEPPDPAFRPIHDFLEELRTEVVLHLGYLRREHDGAVDRVLAVRMKADRLRSVAP